MDLLVSIIIPTFNRRKLVAEAIDSCLSQTWENLEIIIVDDGSTDGTKDFVRGQSAQNWSGRRIQYHHQDNAGAPAARNRGLSLANGTYIQFLDSDDILFNEKIALQTSVLEQSDNAQAEGCSCYGQIGEPVPDTIRNARIGVYRRTSREYLQALSSRLVHGMQTSAPLWRRSFLTTRPGWRTDLECGQDLEYHVRLLAQAKGIKFVEQELFLVRNHPGARVSDNFKNRNRTLSTIRARKAIFETLQSSGHWDRQTQKAFLRAMRTIYANVLSWGQSNDIVELEQWLLTLSRAPVCRRFFPVLIALRKTVGKSAILKAHKLAMATR